MGQYVVSKGTTSILEWKLSEPKNLKGLPEGNDLAKNAERNGEVNENTQTRAFPF